MNGMKAMRTREIFQPEYRASPSDPRVMDTFVTCKARQGPGIGAWWPGAWDSHCLQVGVHSSALAGLADEARTRTLPVFTMRCSTYKLAQLVADGPGDGACVPASVRKSKLEQIATSDRKQGFTRYYIVLCEVSGGWDWASSWIRQVTGKKGSSSSPAPPPHTPTNTHTYTLPPTAMAGGTAKGS
jgi:hypothetical protein